MRPGSNTLPYVGLQEEVLKMGVMGGRRTSNTASPRLLS